MPKALHSNDKEDHLTMLQLHMSISVLIHILYRWNNQLQIAIITCNR